MGGISFKTTLLLPPIISAFVAPVKLKFWRQELHLRYTWTIARGSEDVAPVVLVELSDGGETTGLGEASPIHRYHESADTVEAFCRKVDPSRLYFDDIPGSMAYLDTVAPGNMAAKCAFNLALLDGAGKRAHKPVYDFLNLGFRENHHVTSFTIGIATPDMIRKKVREADSFPVLKVKVGVPDDPAIMAAMREAAPDKPLRLDANEGWKIKEEALARLEWLAQDSKIQFVEQPMPASTHPKDLVWLKERSPLPLFADESYHHAQDVAHCAECFHGVNVKLAKTGGISGGFEALSAARKAGLKTMIGCMVETSVLISAAAHLAELCDYLDIDGNVLIKDDPYVGVTSDKGILSFTNAPEKTGLRVRLRNSRF
jgi:L-alanine-DL-glutamate epimerase-like enolase superfamily enzyme